MKKRNIFLLSKNQSLKYFFYYIIKSPVYIVISFDEIFMPEKRNDEREKERERKKGIIQF